MPADEVAKLRNVAVVGQGGAGKTTVADALLFAGGASTRLGRIDDGSSAFDTEPEEQRRKSTITSSLHHLAWRKHDMNLIDTPGYSSFLHDARNCLYAATGAVLVLGPTGGEVKVEAEKVWGWLAELGIPAVSFVTRMDRERADVTHALKDLEAIGAKPALLQLPIGREAEFRGVVALLSRRAYLDRGESGVVQEAPPPAELADEVRAARERLVETIAEANDALLERYLEGVELTAEELAAALREGVRAAKFVPVLCGAAGRAIGLHPLLDALLDLLPSPADLKPWPGDTAAVSKVRDAAAGATLCGEKHPVVFAPLPDAPAAISFAVAPKSKADDEKVMQGLHRLMEEDTALRVHRDEQTKEFVVSGTGQLHLEVAVERLKRKFGAEVELKAPKVPYKETIKGTAKAQGKHKKQTGGHGQYGDCWLELSPLPRGKGFEFEDAIVGGVIPRNFIPAVEKGVRELLPQGLLAGYPMVDLKVKLYDGTYHDVDSSEMSFKIAAHLGFKKAFEMCKPVLLEPIMTITVLVPHEFMGDVIGDLNSRRGKVPGAQPKGNGQQEIRAHVPMAEVLRY